MTPQKQAFLSDPERGVYGDCWRTAIACLLDMPRDDLPHFGFDANGDTGRQREETDDWLRERGLMLVEIPVDKDTNPEWIGRSGWVPRESHFLLSGESPRAKGRGHVVVMDGNGRVFDPHPDGSGLAGPNGSHWYISFIAKRT